MRNTYCTYIPLPSKEEIEEGIVKFGLMNVATYESVIKNIQERIYNKLCEMAANNHQI